MDNEIAIKVSHVYKDFKLPHDKSNSLKSTLINIFNSPNRNIESQHALKDISFEVKKGEFFGIVGRNGSGKSTLLKILAGIYQPSKGNVDINGRLVPFIELGVGFNPELTGRENVYLNGALLGFSRREIQNKYNNIVTFAELERFMDQKLKNYSSGMQVRLAFSVATVLADSDILLIDEVLAVGDASFQRKCFEYFKSIKKLQKTVIFVSHDMNAIKEYCDRGIVIDNSRMIYSGGTEKIAALYASLFNKSNVKQLAEVDDRWGEGSVKFSNSPSIKISDQNIEIEVEYSKTKSLDSLVIGFSIVNSKGLVILGTNTKILDSKIDLTKESKLVITIPNIFSSDDYRLDLALHDSTETIFYDWWVNSKQFKIDNKHNTPWATSPKVEIASKQNNK